MQYSIDKGWQDETEKYTDYRNAPTKYETPIPPKEIFSVDTEGYTTYFFDSVLGNDLNDGKNELSPKKTVAEANRIVRESNKPTRILFKSGCTFVGNLVLFQSVENTEKPLIVGSYPNSLEKKPVITAETGKNIVEIQTGNVRVSNLEITGKSAYRGIYGCPKKCGAMKNILVENCYVHDVNFFWNLPTPTYETDPDTIDVEEVCPQYLPDGKTYDRYYYRYNGGIIFVNETTEETGASWFEDVYIVRNKVENVARTGITLYSKWSNKAGVFYGYNKPVDDTEKYNDIKTGVGYFVNKRIYFLENTAICVGGDGIVLSSVEDGYVEKNVAYYSNYLGRDNYWNAGIWVYNAKNSYFRYNESAYTYMRHGGQDAQGFDIDNVCENVLMEFNYAHHNEGGGLLCCNLMRPLEERNIDGSVKKDEDGNPIKPLAQGKWYKNTVRNNVFAYNGNIHDKTRAGFLTVARGVDFSWFVNNTVILSGEIENQSVINTEDESQNCYHLYFANNIVYSVKPVRAKYTVKMMKDSTFENNLYYQVGTLYEDVNEKNALTFNPKFANLSEKSTDLKGYIPTEPTVAGYGTALKFGASTDILGKNVTGINYLGAVCNNK